MNRTDYQGAMRLIFATLIVFTLAPNAIGQVQKAPGGITGCALWSENGDSSSYIANYHTLNLLSLELDAVGKIPPMEGATTFFLVLKPSFSQATGAEFIKLGDISVYDNRIDHGTTSTPLDFSDGNPKILTLKMQRSPRYKTSLLPSLDIKDSSLFSLAELIYYPHLKSRESIRMVNTYLAIKYSIPITDISEKQWRDYLASDSTHYWDFTTDKLYGKRVLGVGRSWDEDLFQPQTQTSHGSFLQLSLDTIKNQGVMPRVPIEEDAFLIFSERVPAAYSSLLTCDQKGINPLLNWKLKPHNWDSETSRMFIKMDRPSGVLADSIWITDGFNYTYVPLVAGSPTMLTYSVSLDSLANGLHYFFTSDYGNPCDDLEITVAQNVLTVDMNSISAGDNGFTLKMHKYSNGLLIQEPLNGSLTKELNDGQYQLTVLDRDGKTVVERSILIKLTAGSDESLALIEPELVLMPNPVLVGNLSSLSIKNLPSAQDITLRVSDGSGKALIANQMPYKNGMVVQLTGPTPGLYTISVIQGATVYSIKMLVAAH
ncbi:MAG: hypothetical protein DWQ21_07375 [Bacteroidetes bacterium]|nr:MAG: hypothetical protein DWQ21_07375 [Bacteroidota bacterium]REK64282.1 MAG: hypothetical protein DWQ49_01690 [Bacteroidota bacterium]